MRLSPAEYGQECSAVFFAILTNACAIVANELNCDEEKCYDMFQVW